MIILIVDDGESILGVATAVLASERYSVVCYPTATEALRCLREGNFNISEIEAIISDYKMPNMNGVEFFATVDREYPKHRVRKILMSGNDERGIPKRNYDAFVKKPFHPDDLLKAVRGGAN